MVTENGLGLPPLYELLGFDAIPFIWSTAIGLVITMTVGYGVSLLGPPPAAEQLEGTTLRGVAR